MTPGKVNLGENALEPQAAKNENETHGDDVKKAFVAVGCDTVHAVDKNETNPMGAKTKSFDDKLKLEVKSLATHSNEFGFQFINYNFYSNPKIDNGGRTTRFVDVDE